MKRCVTCHESKPLDAYNIRRSSSDGRQDRCRDCCKSWYAAHAAQHKAAVYERKKRVLPALQQKMADYLAGHPCVDCGEADIRVLEFDHRPGEEKRREISLLLRGGWPWTTIASEIEKCDVRCANCHRRITAVRGGHWRHRAWLDTSATAEVSERLDRLFATRG